LAAKSRKNTEITLPSQPVLTELEVAIEKLSRELETMATLGNSGHVASKNSARLPGRYKGALVVGPEFFEPLTDEDLKAFGPE